MLLTLLRIVTPMLLRGAESGTLAEIAATAARLFELLRPLVTEPAAQQSLETAASAFEAATALRPAQPEDPVFSRQGRSTFGGR